MTVFPCGQAVPEASNLNYRAGQTIPNAAVVKLDAIRQGLRVHVGRVGAHRRRQRLHARHVQTSPR